MTAADALCGADGCRNVVACEGPPCWVMTTEGERP